MQEPCENNAIVQPVSRETNAPIPPNPDTKYHKIYALTDPRTGQVFYVGVTQQKLPIRLTQHISDLKTGKSSRAKLKILRELEARGYDPQIIELDHCTIYLHDSHDSASNVCSWEEKEKEWVARFRQQGYPICNEAEGGKGQHGTRQSEEDRKKRGLGVTRARARSKALL